VTGKKTLCEEERRKTVARGLIIEGISGSGKTSVLKALLQHKQTEKNWAHSQLVLTEYHTQRVLEGKEQQGSLEPGDHLALLEELVAFIEGLELRRRERGWAQGAPAESDFFFVLERFHLTHVFRFPYMNWEMVKPLDQRLKNLNAAIILLTVKAKILEKRLFARRHACWLNYLHRYGSTPAAIVDTFMQRQQLAVDLAARSSLPVITIDTSRKTPAEAAGIILAQL
jgi:thymidylate kinase